MAEQRPETGVALHQILRVPLDGVEVPARGLHPLHHAVGRRGGDGEPRGRGPDGLVMVAVDGQGFLPQQPLQQRPGLQLHPMGQLAADGHILGVAQGAGMLGRQILVQRAAEAHVQKLHAPADAEYRLFRRHATLNHLDFKHILIHGNRYSISTLHRFAYSTRRCINTHISSCYTVRQAALIVRCCCHHISVILCAGGTVCA